MAVAKLKRDSSALIEYGRDILGDEAGAIAALAKQLNGSFAEAVNLILEVSKTGHIIVAGMGKAGLVGMKISATFASIGVPSFFLHPAEAVHGDLGKYTRKDLALLISNSGETEEILRIVPQIKRIGCSIIAMTGGTESQLAKHSDVLLDIGKHSEVGPHGLAPTTSTTVMLALGDALAMTVLKENGMSREEFALFHPAGSLGRALTPIKDLMRKGEMHCVVRSDMKTRDVLHRMTATKGRPGAASIVDEHNRLVGIFTDGDLGRQLDKGIEFLNAPVAEVMGKNPKTVTEEQIAAEALRTLSELKIDQVIVVNSAHEPVGVLDIQDIIELKPR